MYGDQFRSPGRDDRQDGTVPQQAPWAAGHAPAPGPYDDIKVAGAPDTAPPGGQDAGFYDAGVYETTAYDTASFAPSAGPGVPAGPDGNATAANDMGTPYDQGPGPGAPHAYGPGATSGMPGAPDGNATAAYDMGTPYDQGPGAPHPYGPGTTSGLPPFSGGEPAPGGDFEEMRRTPHASHKKLIRFAAVAAAVAVVGGGGVAWAMTGGSSGDKADAGRPVQAQAPAPAPLTDAQRQDVADKRRKELNKRASRAARNQVVRPRLVAKGTPPPTKKPVVATAGNPVPAGEAQQIARGLLPSFGWSPSSQFGCLVNLWNKESHWNVHAANGSGAYGIPQALPGSKMSSAGPDWQNNATTQIKWGLGYIKSRYSSPCGAWSHSESTGWY